MNIIDAVKSGKTCISTQKGQLHRLIPGETHTFTKQDLNADWQIEERKIEITESEFDVALSSVGISVSDHFLPGLEGPLVGRFDQPIKELKKRLFDK